MLHEPSVPWPLARPDLAASVATMAGPDLRGRLCEFAWRRGNSRGAPCDRNVQVALRWLRDHQSADGSWDPVRFADAGARHGRSTGRYGNRDGSADTGWMHARVGITALSVLAFLASGQTHQQGDFRATVQSALRYLRRIQDDDGAFDITGREDPYFVYGHAIATMAMAEACGMTGSCLLKGPAQKGVDFVAQAQNLDPDRGHLGWRYGVRPGDSDTSVTGWMVRACVSARIAGLQVPDHVFEGAFRHFEDMSGRWNGAMRTGYIMRPGVNRHGVGAGPFDPLPSMDAIHLATRLFVLRDPRLLVDRLLQEQADVILACPPTLANPRQRDYYYWHQASLAMFQMGGRWWRDWQRPMNEALTGSQRLAGSEADCCHGSWDSDSAWGMAGGRVYATAINCLTLSVHTRYERAR